jgi:trans-2,3-dihydro-3-hydroxyanthranilate isomerase
VVTDVTGLSPNQMQAIATDLGYSETVFLDWREPGNPRARIFTPAREMPFAGHPLVGAAYVLLGLGPGGPDRIDCEIGSVGIRRDGRTTWVDAPGDQAVEPLIVDLGGWVDPHEMVVVRMPDPYLLIELRDPDRVARTMPRAPAGYETYVWAWIEQGRRVRARFFAPEIGVVEDPGTGSAAVALAAALRHRGVEEGQLIIDQGIEMGAPSRILVHWAAGGTSIGGEVMRDQVRTLEV